MAVRIQLASNFQVVELTYDNWSEVNYEEVSLATAMVNRLGSEVVNEIKTKKTDDKKVSDEPMASDKQIKFAVKLGLNENKAKQMTQKELWQWIQDNK